MKHFILFLALLTIFPPLTQAKSFGSGSKTSSSSSSSSRPAASSPKPAAAPASSSSKPVSFGSGYKSSPPPAAPAKPAPKFGSGSVQSPEKSYPSPSAAQPLPTPTPRSKFGTGVVAGAAAGAGAAAVVSSTSAEASTKETSATTPATTLPPPPAAPNQKALDAQRQAESKAKYDAYKESKESVARTPKPDSDYVKYNMGSDKYWKERESRERVVYRDYYNAPQPTVVYRDNYNPYFFMWLASQSLEVRAATLYNHRNEMDRARYEQQLAENAELKARVAQLEAQGKPDGGYIPPGMDGDLMYNKKIAEGVRKEQKVEEPSEPWSPLTKGVVTFIVVGSLLGAGLYLYRRNQS